MKKTLKLVGIFIGVLVLIIVGGLSGYSIISKNKTFYIYDLRIVVPVEGVGGYVYTDSAVEYKSMPNRKVYMTSSSENLFQLGVYVNTSDNSTNFSIKSSDSSVAKIVYKSGKCYVEYMKAGEATITVKYGAVRDSFKVYVYDQVAEDFNVYDNNYYGEYSSYFANQVVTYSDETELIEYSYDYEAYSVAGEGADDEVNNALLRVDQTHINKDLFEKVKIDDVTKQLKITCKAGLTKNTDETIVVQSYYYSEYGDIRISNNYFVNVHIEAYTPEFLQVVVSKTPDFEDCTVLMNTKVTKLTPSEVENDVEKVEQFLDYQKAESNLVELNEKALYNVYFNEKVSKLYLKFRKVYTNGHIEYLNPTTDDVNPHTIDFDENYMKLSPNKTYYTLTLSEAYFTSPTKTFNVKVSLDDYDLLSTFKFEYKTFNEDNLHDYYAYDAETKVFTYKYWDPRSRYYDEIYDIQGNIISFGSINMNNVDYSLFE